MGDASLPTVQTQLQSSGHDQIQYATSNSIREVHVLVTGFGSFKSFATNPSYLVASNLSRHLNPESQSASVALANLKPSDQYPIRSPDPRPYRVIIHVYPSPIRVAYNIVGSLVPRIITDSQTEQSPQEFTRPENGFDYVLHIGMAAGRENYTLETLAHRDFYRLKDVDDKDGSAVEVQWKDLGLPEILDVGWNKQDVLSRWEVLTRQREDEYEFEEMSKAGWKENNGMTLVETARLRSQVFLGKGRRAVVKLSRDAGRYLCEFIFYTALGTRWMESRDKKPAHVSVQLDLEQEKLGKVAFLHVPGGVSKHDVARGIRVAESMILAMVGSWEDGYRNPDLYGGQKTGPGDSSAMYESKGTGDR